MVEEAPTEMYDAATAFEAPVMAEEETGERMEGDVFGSGGGGNGNGAGRAQAAGGGGGWGWGGRKG